MANVTHDDRFRQSDADFVRRRRYRRLRGPTDPTAHATAQVLLEQLKDHLQRNTVGALDSQIDQIDALRQSLLSTLAKSDRPLNLSTYRTKDKNRAG